MALLVDALVAVTVAPEKPIPPLWSTWTANEPSPLVPAEPLGGATDVLSLTDSPAYPQVALTVTTRTRLVSVPLLQTELVAPRDSHSLVSVRWNVVLPTVWFGRVAVPIAAATVLNPVEFKVDVSIFSSTPLIRLEATTRSWLSRDNPSPCRMA